MSYRIKHINRQGTETTEEFATEELMLARWEEIKSTISIRAADKEQLVDGVWQPC